jgi:pyruvate dehydrogenase E2 component (dihydrolipoamide acetyltransferase)
MARLLQMPQVTASAEPASVQSWLVGEGEAFSAGSALLVVETDKAVVDVDADHDGVLLRVLAPAGSTVEVGRPIAVLGDPGEGPGAADAVLAGWLAGHEMPGNGVLGSGVVGDDGRRSASPGRRAASGEGERLFASPLARRLARGAGLDPAALTGSGPAGRIVRRDVEAAVRNRSAATAAAAAATIAPAPAPLPQGAADGFTDVPHPRMRRAIAARLTAAKQEIPHFYLRRGLRVDRLLALRSQLNAEPGVDAPRISVTDLLITAIGRAHTRVPQLNAIWTADALRTFTGVDVAVAVATDGGLVTPVLRGVDRLTVSQVSTRARELAELEGGSITLTNLGMFDVEEFAAIINPPQAAVLAVGAAARQPVVVADRMEIATVMRVTLSVDHRAVDGVTAARWLQEFTRLVENPVRILT